MSAAAKSDRKEAEKKEHDRFFLACPCEILQWRVALLRILPLCVHCDWYLLLVADVEH